MNAALPNWNGERVLITGGTSGLGRALALKLAAAGARVAVVARNREGLQALTALSPGIVAIQGDVSNKDEIHSIAAQALHGLGGVDVLINNASSLGVERLKPLIDTECEELEAALATNFLGPFRLTRILLSDMLLRSGGTVINITSDASVNAYPGWGAYGTSKAALDHLTRIWNEELGSRGVRFHALDPGDMDTPLHFQALPDADPASLRSPDVSAERILSAILNPDRVETRSSV